MKVVVSDWETFFDSASGYTLKKMTTEAYLRDPRFRAHGCAVKWDAKAKAQWIPRSNLHLLSQHDWSDTMLIHHHANFDSGIESFHYGIRPKAIGCTLSMARLLLGNHVSVSLDSVRSHFGLPSKLTPYHLFDGKHWDELTSREQKQVADGACDEVESIWYIFQRLARDFPAEEYPIVDATVRMFTEPCLIGDVPALKQVWANEHVRKAQLLAEVGVTVKELRSDAKFAELLRAEGVEPATKPGTNGPIYAFAKSDKFLKDLEEHDNERVAALAAARIGNKTSIKQTRAVRMAHMAERGPMCIYLSYAGAHTTRFSGGDKLNFQNPPPDLKRCIVAPPGHKLAIVDSAQGECRLANMIAGQMDVIERFRSGQDPYVNVASEFYKRPITKEADPAERQVGKVLELQCQFGSGADKIGETLRIKAGLILDPERRLAARDAYRNTHPYVVAAWKECDRSLIRLSSFELFDWGPFRFRCDEAAGTRRILLPNDVPLIFDTLHWAVDEEINKRGWQIKTRDGLAWLWGSKLFENMIQAIHRLSVTQAMNRIKAAGIRIATMTHDDIVCCIPDDHNIHNTFQFVKEQMKLSPGWLPGIPLDVEGHLSDRYEK